MIRHGEEHNYPEFYTTAMRMERAAEWSRKLFAHSKEMHDIGFFGCIVHDGERFVPVCEHGKKVYKILFGRRYDDWIKEKTGIDRLSASIQGDCALCHEELGEFKDELSAKDAKITQMCQKCQDKIYETSE